MIFMIKLTISPYLRPLPVPFPVLLQRVRGSSVMDHQTVNLRQLCCLHLAAA